MNNIDNLMQAVERTRGIYIECGDAKDVIETWDTPFTLHYCDPPYPGTDCGPYTGEFTLDNLQALVDTLAECKGSVMLSNYDHDTLQVPKDWVRHEFEASATVAKEWEIKPTRKEVLWVCDRSGNAPDDQKKYMWSPSKGYCGDDKPFDFFGDT